MQTGLRGPERDPERGRDFGQRLVEEEMGDDDGPHPRIELAERSLHLVTIHDQRAGIPSRDLDRRGELDFDDTAATPPQDGQTGPDDDPVDPGIEPVGVAQARQIPPRLDECVLDRVARELRVPEDQASRRVQPRDDPADERGEGVMIALSGPLDESSLVHRRSPVSARPFDRARILRCRLNAKGSR